MLEHYYIIFAFILKLSPLITNLFWSFLIVFLFIFIFKLSTSLALDTSTLLNLDFCISHKYNWFDFIKLSLSYWGSIVYFFFWKYAPWSPLQNEWSWSSVRPVFAVPELNQWKGLEIDKICSTIFLLFSKS